MEYICDDYVINYVKSYNYVAFLFKVVKVGIMIFKVNFRFFTFIS